MAIIGIISFVVECSLPQVVINEVMANPKGSETGAGSPGDRNEFIELYNNSDDTVDLTNWILTDGDDDDFITFWSDTAILTKYPGVRIRSIRFPPFSFALILDPEYTSADTIGGNVQPYEIPESTLILTVKNTTLGDGLANNDPLVLKDKLGNVISTFGTPDSEDDFPLDAGDGKSWERISFFAPDTKEGWQVSSDKSGSTPGKGNSTSVLEKRERQKGFGLNPPAPNPWTTQTKIGFFLPEEGIVSLAVYAIDGRLALPLFYGTKPRGYHELSVSRLGLGGGSYFFRLKSNAEEVFTKTVILE